MSSTATGKASPKEIIAYFSTPAHPVKLAELSEFRKSDKVGYDQIAEGIGDGSLTY